MGRIRGLRALGAGIVAAIAGWAILSLPLIASARPFTASAVVVRDGNPMLLVDGRPFFFYGAAFFYERIPAGMWRPSMLALRTLGFNTLDLYLPWNWHEVADGDFDFSGRTNPRRNLRAVLALARELHFKLIVRPGPVIRNEWRNGGYPAWLLTRPEYGMPLHDVLEGRYPATATLQNANSDDAAAQWLANATHLQYAGRWLRTALAELEPYADLVIAVQLDDDQGAYIDNQTWPAPHLQTYLRTLESTVRGVVGPQLPVFINTYEMKVTASAPVWAMGNWYQSDAYSIGEHDRAALEFSTGLLQTQTRYPLAMSEFGAGWLAPPEDPAPRPADPTNTTLALHTLVGFGLRGVIDFPAQDTLNPAGWEAPFANAAYAWDAALDVALRPSARYAPTKRFGDLVRADGSDLSAARRLADGAIAYLTSAYDEARLTNADVFAIAARTQAAQLACRLRHLVCDLVDLRFADDTTLRRYPFLIVPRDAIAQPLTALARGRLTRYRAAGGRVVIQPPDVVTPLNGGIADATVLVAPGGVALLDIVNYDSRPRRIPATRIRLPNGARWFVGPLTVPARDAVLLRYDRSAAYRSAVMKSGWESAGPGPSVVGRSAPAFGGSVPGTAVAPARPNTVTPSAGAPSGVAQSAVVPSPVDPSPAVDAPAQEAPGDDCPSAAPLRRGPPFSPPRIIEDDRAGDGYPRLTLANDLISLTLAPNAGGRAFTFVGTADGCPGESVFTSVGGLRDDVALQLPLSTTDRIGKYTRSFPAGFFNRPYVLVDRTSTPTSASATLRYDAPDVVPDGARFERTISVSADEPGFLVTQRVTFGGGARAAGQRAVRYDSFDMRDATIIDDRANGVVGFFYAAAGRVVVVAWPPAEVEDARLIPERTSTVLRLQFGRVPESHTRYLLEPSPQYDQAWALILKERFGTGAKP